MRPIPFTNPLGFFLGFLLILPDPAFALRPAGPDDPRGGVRTGLEEALQPSLSAGAEESGKKSALRWMPVAAVLVGATISTWVALNFIQPGKQAGPGPLSQPPAKVAPKGKEVVSPKGKETAPLKAGAFAALRQKLGPDRQIGIIVWDPTDLVRKADLKGFFADSVREGIDTVYLSGYRFMGRLRHSERQSLLDSASKAGVRRILFIDGNDDWPINRNFVSGFYTELTQESDRLDWHGMERGYTTDIEEYPRKSWKGDMGPRADLVEQVILPLVNKSKHKGPLWEFHPWWMEPGRRTDSGAVVRNLRFPKGTGISVMSYGGSAEDIFRLTAPTRRQALEQMLPWQLGVETIPGQGVPHFGGSKAAHIPRVLADTVDLIRARDSRAFDRFDGVYVHTKGPPSALRVVNGLAGGSDKAEEKPPAVKPAPQFGVQGDKAAVFTGQRIVLNLTFSKAELTGEPWVGFVFTKIKEDLWYIQPTADEEAAFPVTLVDNEEGFNATIEFKAHPNRPFDVPVVDRLAGIFMPKSKARRFLEAYQLNADNRLTAPSAMSAAMATVSPREIRVIDLGRAGTAAMRKGGLEEEGPRFVSYGESRKRVQRALVLSSRFAKGGRYLRAIRILNRQRALELNASEWFLVNLMLGEYELASGIDDTRFDQVEKAVERFESLRAHPTIHRRPDTLVDQVYFHELMGAAFTAWGEMKKSRGALLAALNEWDMAIAIASKANLDVGRFYDLKGRVEDLLDRSSAGSEEIQVKPIHQLLSEAEGLFAVPAGITHAFLLDKKTVDARSAVPESMTVDLYTHDSISAGALQVLPASWRLGAIRRIPEDAPEAAVEMEKASAAVSTGKNVVVALDFRRREGLALPHALILLLDPATQDKLDRNVLAAYLERRESLLYYLLDLTSGSVVTVRIAGREYYAVLATAA